MQEARLPSFIIILITTVDWLFGFWLQAECSSCSLDFSDERPRFSSRLKTLSHAETLRVRLCGFCSALPEQEDEEPGEEEVL